MKYITIVLCVLAQIMPCHAHEGHDKAFANKDAMVATNQKLHIEPEGQASIGLKTQAVKCLQLEKTLDITGKVEAADDRINLVTSPVAGIVSRIFVQQGAKVRQGQPLAQLYSAEVASIISDLLDQRAAIDAEIVRTRVQAQNEIQVGSRDVSHFETDVEREQKLLAEGITARKNYLEAVHSLDIAKTKLAGTKTQLQQNIAALETRKRTITDTTRRRLTILGVPTDQLNKTLSGADAKVIAEIPIISPATGTVLSRDITQGESVENTRKLFSIVNLSPIWISLDIHQDQLSLIRLGQSVLITGPDKQTISGTVSSIDPAVNSAERTVHVRVVADNPNGVLRPEMFVTASITIGKQADMHIVVPAEAVITDGGRSLVFVSLGNDFQAVPVKIGVTIKGKTEIIDGLYDGDQLVINGANQLRAQSMIAGKNLEPEKIEKPKANDEVVSFLKGRDWLTTLTLIVGGMVIGLFGSRLLSAKRSTSNE